MTTLISPDHAISFPAVAAKDARLLILGSMPGVASLKQHQYYAHPRNAFWPIMVQIFDFENNANYQQRCDNLVTNQVALWDVLKMCRRPGSLDQHIDKDTIVINDLSEFLTQHQGIELILFNGTTAANLFKRHVTPTLTVDQKNIPQVRMPSTSPAHASVSFAQKLAHWQQVIDTRLKK